VADLISSFLSRSQCWPGVKSYGGKAPPAECGAEFAAQVKDWLASRGNYSRQS
jgi:hypothetical protein